VLHPVRGGAVARVHEVETMAQRVVRQTTSGGAYIQLAVRLGVLAFLVYWSFVLVRPFIPMLVWSMVLAVALYPPYNWLSVHLGDRPKLAAAIITVINLAIVIGPVTWLGYGVVDGLQDFARQLGAGTLVIPSPPDGVKEWPVVGTQIYELWNHASTNLGVAFEKIAPHSSHWLVRCLPLPAARAWERSSSSRRWCCRASCSITAQASWRQ
jgi:predicted PurR-regulated permease PerM